MAIYEGRWLCKQCGSENLGRYEECNGLDGNSGCGKSRPKDVEFYLPENSPVVTDGVQLADAKSGTDWYCTHCEGANKNAYTGRRAITCVHCGNPRESDDVNHRAIVYPLDEVPRGVIETARRVESRPHVFVGAARKNSSHEYARYLWVGVPLLIFIVCVWFFFFASVHATASVDSLSWSREVSVEKYQTVLDEGWAEPSGARRVSATRKVHHYDRLIDHYESKSRLVTSQVQTGTESYVCGKRSLGNGYFEDEKCSRPVYGTVTKTESYQEPVYRDNPVYGTWYIYYIKKWVYHRKHDASGSSHEVYWPQYQLAEDERVSEKKETYHVILGVDKNKPPLVHEMSFDEWRNISMGQTFALEMNRFGSILSFDGKK